jgi:hypothetical protein
MGRRANTISDKDWKSIQDRAVKANPALKNSFSDQSAKRSAQARANLKNRENC